MENFFQRFETIEIREFVQPRVVTDDNSLVRFDQLGNEYSDAAVAASDISLSDWLQLVAADSESLGWFDPDTDLANMLLKENQTAWAQIAMQWQLGSNLEFDSGTAIERLSLKYWADDGKYAGEGQSGPNITMTVLGPPLDFSPYLPSPSLNRCGAAWRLLPAAGQLGGGQATAHQLRHLHLQRTVRPQHQRRDADRTRRPHLPRRRRGGHRAALHPAARAYHLCSAAARR